MKFPIIFFAFFAFFARELPAQRISSLPRTNSVAGTNTIAVSIFPNAITNGTWQLSIENLFSNQTVRSPLIEDNLSYSNRVITGTGGTNFAFTGYGLMTINASTNVSIRGAGTVSTGRGNFWTLNITNGSGANRTLEFSAVTNRWKWSQSQASAVPQLITNGTMVVITAQQQGTNIWPFFAIFDWP